MSFFLIFFQLLLLIALAPLLSGMITRIKNNFRMRQGPTLWQPYYNLTKLFGKGEVVSTTASWIFRIAPFIVIASSLTAGLLIPVLILPSPLNKMGDFLALIFIFSLGRFFLALAALDTGSSFAGMGSSREMFISSLVEPVLCLSAFVLFLQFRSTNIASWCGLHAVSVSQMIVALAMFLVLLAETSRIPVDNQETHLELTMVHEAMTLEYSGRSLALIEMSSYIKQMIWFLLIAQIIFPIDLLAFSSLGQGIMGILWYGARLFIIALIVSIVEVSLAKMRLFRVVDFLGFALVLGITGAVCALLGV